MTESQTNLFVEQKVLFEVYFKRIFEKKFLPARMYLTITLTYKSLRALEEIENKDEKVICDRISFDEDPNIRYNCSFDIDEDSELERVIMNPTNHPSFDGMNESNEPIIYFSSLANETMTEKGIQAITGNGTFNINYLMNNTVLEEKDSWFKLTGEMDYSFGDKQIILYFDEKGNGKLKQVICEISYLKDNIFELNCLGIKGINAHLNGVIGITITSQEKLIIYIKPGTDEFLDVGIDPIPKNSTQIPSVISQPIYDPQNKKPSHLLLSGIGNFQIIENLPNVFQKVNFEIYFKRLFGQRVLSIRLYLYITVTYIRLRVLEEAETEKKDDLAVCDRITFDEDPDIRYNCSFYIDEDSEVSKVTMNPSNPPKFLGMSDDILPTITVSSLANQTINEKGIQTATGNELLKTQYLMNNTILEENGLRFILIGEMDSYLPDKLIVLAFDEKGDGTLKNATCDINYLQGNIFELDCLAEQSINSHLNGVVGITCNTLEKLIIYMKPGTDELLNVGKSYLEINNKNSNNGLSKGIIIIIIIIIIACITLFIIFSVLIYRKNRKTKENGAKKVAGDSINTTQMSNIYKTYINKNIKLLLKKINNFK